MMKHYFLFLAAGLFLVGTAQAQVTYSVGPRVGLNVSSVRFPTTNRDAPASRPGLEAGLTGTAQFGHFALQPSLLFSQKGYRHLGYLLNFDLVTPYEEDVRLHYLTLPLNLAFTLGRDGQGLQVFAGPYASLLLGGSYSQRMRGLDGEATGQVKAASREPDTDNRYVQRFDGGLQAGLGYRLKGLQLQASYSLGLRSLGVPYRPYRPSGGSLYEEALPYYNQAFQVALSYLFAAKS